MGNFVPVRAFFRRLRESAVRLALIALGVCAAPIEARAVERTTLLALDVVVGVFPGPVFVTYGKFDAFMKQLASAQHVCDFKDYDHGVDKGVSVTCEGGDAAAPMTIDLMYAPSQEPEFLDVARLRVADVQPTYPEWAGILNKYLQIRPQKYKPAP